MQNLLFTLLLLFTTFLLSANEGGTVSTIEAVTVYRSGAQIQRKATITLQPGINEFVFANLSPAINEHSIQVAGLENATIHALNFSLSYLEKKAISNEVKKLNTLLEALNQKKNAQDNILLGLTQEQHVLENNQRVSSNKTMLSLENVKEISNYYKTRIAAIYDQRYDVQLRLGKLQIAIDNTTRELQKTQGATKEERGTIKLKISTPSPTNLALLISYTVQHAGWFPVYDVKAMDLEQPLHFSYKANISQQTGCDWKNVDIIVSTGDPNTNSTKPILDTKNLNFTHTTVTDRKLSKSKTRFKYNPTVKQVNGIITDDTGSPLPGVVISVDGKTIGANSYFDGKYTIAIPSGKTLTYSCIGYRVEDIPIYATTMNVTMQSNIAALNDIVIIGYKKQRPGRISKRKSATSNKLVTEKQENITNTRFKIAKKHTIDSNKEVTSIEIDHFEIPTTYEHFVAPELNEHVFLTAKLKNWEQYAILPGDATLYFEGNYAGKTYINPIETTEHLIISLGIDPGVIVHRKQLNNYKSKLLLGTTKAIDQGYTISIKNNKGSKINLIMEDRIPVTQNKEIKIDHVEVGDAQFDSKKGILSWRMNLPSRGTQKKSFTYRVKYPKNQHINL